MEMPNARDEGRFRLRRPYWMRWTGSDVEHKNMKRSWLEAVKMVNAMDPEHVYGYRIQVNTKREVEINGALAEGQQSSKLVEKTSRDTEGESSRPPRGGQHES